MSHLWLFAACLTVCLLPAATAAQTRSWAAVANGLWNTPTRWSPTNVPNTTGESATFDLFGAYGVTLDGSTGPVSINHLNIVRGDITLRPNGVTDATISAAGDASLAGRVILGEVGGKHLHLQAKTLSVLAGTQVDVEGGSLSAGTTVVAGGTATDITNVQLLDGATGAFGWLSIAPSGSVTSRSAIDLYDGASATMLGLSIAATASSGLGELNVKASTLTQPASNTSTIGAASGYAGRLGKLTVSDAGTLQLGSATVNPTGRVVNDNALLRVAGSSLTLHGGQYLETGAATRDFSAVTNLRIDAGGEMSLVGAPLAISAGRTVTILDGSLKSAGGIQVSGGTLALGAGSAVVGDISWGSGSRLVLDHGVATGSTPLHVTGDLSLAGTLDFESFGTMALGLTAGSTLPLLTAGSISGEFDAIVGPALAGGLRWDFQQTPTSLIATVVGASTLAGDYSGDGLVNAADYTVWRDSVAAGNTVGSYAQWSANYGRTAAASGLAVPEPSVLSLLAPLIGALARRRP